MKQLGKTGESIAIKYLIKKKYTIIDKNYRNALGEIDIIAKFKEEIIFIEVKTRKSRRYGYPEEAVNISKQKKIIKTASWYIARKGFKGNNFRFDVILIDFYSDKSKKEKIKHIKNAFFISERNNPFGSQKI